MASTTDTKGIITTSILTDIATAIRAKNGETIEYLPSQMANKISNLYLANTVKFWIDNELYEIASVKTGNAVSRPTTDPAGLCLGWTTTPGSEELVTFPIIPTTDMNLYCAYATLPNEYQRVTHIESTGVQYIEFNQNFSSTEPKYIQITFSPNAITGTSPSGSYNGVMGVNSNPQLGFYKNGWCVGNAGSASPYIPVIGTTYVVTWNKINNGDYRVDDLPTGISRAGTLTTRLCWIENGSSNCKNNIYEVRIIHRLTGSILFCAIPCYRKEDTKPGMYDLIGRQFYVNAATGADFILGEDVN